MEPRLGADLSDVKVHPSGDSASAAKDLGARAFTVGTDVHFNAGEYAPGSREGDRLLAHELTHVVQGQKSGIQRKEDPAAGGDEKKEGGAEGGAEVSDPAEPAEKEADAKGDQVAGDLHDGKGDEKGEKGGKGDEKGEKGGKGGGKKKDKDSKEEKESKKAQGLGEEGGEDGEKKAEGGDHKPDGEKKAEGGGEKGEAGAKKAEGGEKKAEGGEKKAEGPKEAAPNVGAKLMRKIYLAGTPATAPAPQGAAKDDGPNPNFAADAQAFETKLGPVAYGHGAAVGPALVAKVRAYIEAKCKAPLIGPIDQLKAELAKLTSKPGFAGGVGTPEDVKQILSTKEELEKGEEGVKKLSDVKEGNLREQMTIVANFGNLMNGDLLASKPEDIAKVQDWIKQAGLAEAEIDKRMERAKKAGGAGGAAAAPWPEQPAGQVPKGGSGAQGDAQAALAGQSDARVAKNPAKNPDGSANPRRADRSKEGAPDDPTRTNNTPGQMAAGGMPLSDREMKNQGNPGMQDQLKWSEGVKTWMVDKDNKWVQAQQQLGIPLGAGPSGTTNMLMNTSQMLGGAGAEAVRMACIGYLLPINAHSLVEILTAAAAHGVPFTSGTKMYHDIKPMSEDELRSSCGRAGGKDGKNLFPDEKTPGK
jgi:hypothetical protein